MAVQMAIWKMTNAGPLPLTFSQLGQEQLQVLIEALDLIRQG